MIRCDRCGDPLPALEAREMGLATPDMLRRGVGADEVICPACASWPPPPVRDPNAFEKVRGGVSGGGAVLLACAFPLAAVLGIVVARLA